MWGVMGSSPRGVTNYTKKGLYYLSGVTSSIKTVWPLDSILTSQSDSPKLNLNYVNREIFPYLNNSNKVVKNARYDCN